MTDAPPLNGTQVVGPHINLDALFAQQFDMSFKKLSFISDSGRQKNANLFYLLFPPSAHEEFELLWYFLEKHKVIVLSNIKGDDWEKFSKSSEGVVLVLLWIMCLQEKASLTL